VLTWYLFGLGEVASYRPNEVANLERAYCFSSVSPMPTKTGTWVLHLNPTAAAVRYAQHQGYNKILIVDWDIHHGDGTQSIFAMIQMHCISIHSAADLYMHSHLVCDMAQR